MNDDVLPVILESVKEYFHKRYGDSKKIELALKRIEKSEATYLDANEYAVEVGIILAEAFGEKVKSAYLPDGRMYYNIAKRLVEETLKNNYALVSDYTVKVQEILNSKSRISLEAKRPTYNAKRVDGIIGRLANEEKYSDISWILKEPIIQFTQSVVDDAIRENASFHSDAGLSPKIIRRTSGKCCEWCQALVGTWEYGYEPQDVYRRHNNCRCTVDYYPGDGKKQNVWSKKITDAEQDERRIREQQKIDIMDNNRKVDKKEYEKLTEKLGEENIPRSLAKFQEMKYNDVEGYRALKDRAVWGNAEFPSKRSFDGHFKAHVKEFGNISKEKYRKLAASLLAKPTSKEVLGYETENRRVRYSRTDNIYVLGNPNTERITTMFKPENGEEYYNEEIAKDMDD